MPADMNSVHCTTPLPLSLLLQCESMKNDIVRNHCCVASVLFVPERALDLRQFVEIARYRVQNPKIRVVPRGSPTRPKPTPDSNSPTQIWSSPSEGKTWSAKSECDTKSISDTSAVRSIFDLDPPTHTLHPSCVTEFMSDLSLRHVKSVVPLQIGDEPRNSEVVPEEPPRGKTSLVSSYTMYKRKHEERGWGLRKPFWRSFLSIPPFFERHLVNSVANG